MSEGTFITVEGIDGSGKTTVVESIAEKYDCYTTSEPSDFWTGRQVRKALREDTPKFTDFFLFMADRQMHIEKYIKPRLQSGEMVVSDRFSHSTYAYQSVQLEDHLEAVSPYNWMRGVMEPWNIEPDLTIYIDIDVETALERADEEEKYEKREMLEEVKANYNLLCMNTPYMRRIDGSRSKSAILNDCKALIEEIR